LTLTLKKKKFDWGIYILLVFRFDVDSNIQD